MEPDNYSKLHCCIKYMKYVNRSRVEIANNRLLLINDKPSGGHLEHYTMHVDQTSGNSTAFNEEEKSSFIGTLFKFHEGILRIVPRLFLAYLYADDQHTVEDIEEKNDSPITEPNYILQTENIE